MRPPPARPARGPGDRMGDTASLGPPAVPPAVVGLLAAIGSDDTGIRVLAAAVSEFPSIAARLLMLANSAWSAPARPITSIHDACLRLGLRVVRSVSLAMAVARPFDPNRCPGFDVVRYWTSALMVAEASALLSPHLVRHDPDCDEGTLRSAGLLHNLGLLWLADRWPVATAAALARVEEGTRLGEALHEAVGVDHREAAGTLGRAWGLPAPLVAAMRFHAAPDYRGDHWQVSLACGLASSLVERLDAAPEGTEDREGLDTAGLLTSDALDRASEALTTRRDAVAALTTCLFGQAAPRK